MTTRQYEHLHELKADIVKTLLTEEKIVDKGDDLVFSGAYKLDLWELSKKNGLGLVNLKLKEDKAEFPACICFGSEKKYQGGEKELIKEMKDFVSKYNGAMVKEVVGKLGIAKLKKDDVYGIIITKIDFGDGTIFEV